MSPYDVRYEMTISTDHESVTLRDQETDEIHQFRGPHALYNALGVLADWRERDKREATR